MRAEAEDGGRGTVPFRLLDRAVLVCGVFGSALGICTLLLTFPLFFLVLDVLLSGGWGTGARLFATVWILALVGSYTLSAVGERLAARRARRRRSTERNRW